MIGNKNILNLVARREIISYGMIVFDSDIGRVFEGIGGGFSFVW